MSRLRGLRIIPAICMAGMIVSCSNDLDRVAAIELGREAPDRITIDAEYIFSDSGMVRNTLKAGRIEEYKGEAARTVMSDGVEVRFFDRQGDPNSLLTARRGKILPDEHRMEVFDDVVFINAKGERLETEHLIWLQDSARVHTDAAVRVLRGQDVIHGQGLDATEDLSRYTIRRITGTLNIEEGDTLAP